MPKYTADIEYIIRPDDMKAMLAECKSIKEQAILSTLYITGCRPAELLAMERDDVRLLAQDGRMYLVFSIERKKLRKGKFHVKKRNLYIKYKPNSLMQNCILKYRETLPVGSKLFDIPDRTLRHMIERVSKDALGEDKQLCPYNFRHSRFTILAEQGYMPHELKYIKGADDLRSVEPYLHARPMEITVKDDGKNSDIILSD